MSTPEERAEKIASMISMNAAMRTLRKQIEAAARLARESDEMPMAFAAFCLADSIGVYMQEVTSFMQRELAERN